jgi:hypothetical protein
MFIKNNIQTNFSQARQGISLGLIQINRKKNKENSKY